MSRDDSTAAFAKCLCERMEELRLNRRSLAEQMNVTEATVGNWLRGKWFPEIGSRERLCKLLGMSTKQLRLPPFDKVN